MIEVCVELSDGQHKILKLSNKSRVTDALLALTVGLGLNPSCIDEIKKEWGLAIAGPLVYKDKKWINLEWLDPHIHVSSLAAEEPLSLLFGKRLFSRQDETVAASLVLRQLLYYQLMTMYTSGLFYSDAKTSAKLSALAAYVGVSSNQCLLSGKKWLKGYIPPRLRNVPRMITVVTRNMDSIGSRPVDVVQVAFIKGLMKLDGFGVHFYSATVDGHHGALGIGQQHICWCDNQTFEIIDLWQTRSVASLATTPTSVTINSQEGTVTIEALRISQIHQLLHDVTVTSGELYDSYRIQCRDDTTDDSQEEVEMIHVSKSMSPINRTHLRRKAFRKKTSHGSIEESAKVYPVINHSDTVDSLNQLLNTDFTREAEWSNANPIYNQVAGTRIDLTLKRSRITYTSLTQTLQKQAAERRKDASVVPVSEDTCQTPPPTPPPRRASQVAPPTPPPHRGGRFALSPPPPTPPPRKNRRSTFLVPATVGDDLEPEEQPHNHLGVYPLETQQSITEGVFGQKSRMIPPNEALKDYSTLMREFRTFYVKLPNGSTMWELASLYQPLHKLVSRLCILCHIECSDNYQLYVEGSILSQLDKHEMEQPCSPRDYTPSPAEEMTGTKVTAQEQTVHAKLLDEKLSLKDQGVFSSKILSLRPRHDHQERLPPTPIAAPLWVRFHQCWLSVVHGSLPCTTNEAIMLAAIIYQLYVLDRSESNSVIGFCSVADFLPPEYRGYKRIERKVLAQRASFLHYSREELQSLYVQGVSTLPLYNTVFFKCKEPRKQFLANIKMHSVLIGINQEGLLRVDPKTKHILDTWPYEVLRNWGSTANTFMIVFESSTYPVKTNQSKWMTELLVFHINSMLRVKGDPNRANSPVLHQETGQERRQYFSLEETAASSRPYFCLEEERGKHSEIEKVYEELMLARDKTQDKNTVVPKVEVTDPDEVCQPLLESIKESAYVNPKPGCSLINPNTPMREHMEKLGVYKRESKIDETYDEPCSKDSGEEDLYHSHGDRVFISDVILDHSDSEAEDENFYHGNQDDGNHENDIYHSNDDIIHDINDEGIYHSNDEGMYHSNDDILYDNNVDEVIYHSNEDICVHRDMIMESSSDSEGIYDDIIVNTPLLLYNK